MNQSEETSFDRMVADLQKEIVRQEREVFSEVVIAEAYHPRNMGRMAQADAQAVVHGWCGDTMELYLRLSDGMIEEASFMTDGCGATVACGSMITTMARGLSLEKAGEIEPDDLIAALDGLPKKNEHCAELAVKTLRKALINWPTEGGCR